MLQQVRNIDLIFWGVLIVIIDISFYQTTNGVGFNIDIINDLVGSIMIFRGLSNISKIKIADTAFNSKMSFSLFAAGLQILHSISDFFIYAVPDFINSFATILDLIIDWGLVTFAGAMIILSKEYFLEDSLKKWITTEKLFLYIYFLPFAILTVFSEIISLFNPYRFNWAVEFGLGGAFGTILIISILLIPLIYGLFTLYSMKEEILEKHNNY